MIAYQLDYRSQSTVAQQSQSYYGHGVIRNTSLRLCHIVEDDLLLW